MSCMVVLSVCLYSHIAMWQPRVEAIHSSVAYSDHVFMFELLILWPLFEGDYSRGVTIQGGHHLNNL